MNWQYLNSLCDRAMNLCAGKLTNIGSYNGLWHERCLAIIWTSAGILLIGPLGTNFNEILIGIQTFSLNKIQVKISSGKWQPFGLSLDVLNDIWVYFLSSQITRKQGPIPAKLEKTLFMPYHLSLVDLTCGWWTLGPVSISDKTSYRTILWSLVARWLAV